MVYKVSNIPQNYSGFYRNYWNYFNYDSGGEHPNTCCGQAAIFSVMMTMGKSYPTGFKYFVKTYPPNNFFGTLGTGKNEILRILTKNKLYFDERTGETALRQQLKCGPVIVCLDVGAAGWGKWGLHWVAVFGYTESHYYLNNWEPNTGADFRCSRANFNKGWNTWMTNTASQTSNWMVRISTI